MLNSATPSCPETMAKQFDFFSPKNGGNTMKKILSLLAISFSLAFAYTAADVYGAWSPSGELWDNMLQQSVFDDLLIFDKKDFSSGKWRLNNAMITFSNSNHYCVMISAKIMDCQTGKGKTTFKKAATIAQVEQNQKRFEKEWAKQDSLKKYFEKVSKQPFYKNLEQAKAKLQKIYGKHKNIEKGEFESTADFNKRIGELDKNLKDSTEFYFNRALIPIIDEIENDTTSQIYLSKYDADKQISVVGLIKVGGTIYGKVKMSPEIAKNLSENREQFSFKYERTDLRNVDYSLMPIKMGVYDKNGERYEVNFDMPKTAKEIVFKGAELWKDNPHAKNLSVSLAEAIQRNVSAKEEQIKKNEVLAMDGLTDTRDGKKYKLVNIGSQLWMAENLNHDVSGSKCYYNKPENCQKYGSLYRWKIAMEACPESWHLPSNEEWETLKATAGGEKKFNAVSGLSNDDGDGYWWSSSNDGGYAYYYEVTRNKDGITRDNWSKDGERSVRCVMD